MGLNWVRFRFNSQPPEGGWLNSVRINAAIVSFNSQPPEGGWILSAVSAHEPTGFNSQPPEGGWPSINDS